MLEYPLKTIDPFAKSVNLPQEKQKPSQIPTTAVLCGITNKFITVSGWENLTNPTRFNRNLAKYQKVQCNAVDITGTTFIGY